MISGPKVEIPPLGTLGHISRHFSTTVLVHLRDREHHRSPKPGLDVHGSFFDVRPFPFIAFDTLVVGSQSTTNVSRMAFD